MKTLLLIACAGLLATSIYTKQFTTLSGTQVSMAQYEGKKILLVNIASGSSYAASQLPQLQQLYQQYHDSLEVIAFPSNDFGNEPLDDSTLQMLLQNTYNISFPVSVITGINDSAATVHPVYQWLQRATENGMMDAKVKSDFQKYLIDKNGNIMGIFSAETNPMDSTVVEAVLQ